MPIFSFIGYNLAELSGNLTINGKFVNKRARPFTHQTMCLTRVEKKKLLGRRNKVAKWLEAAT